MTGERCDWVVPIARMLDAHAWRGQYIMAVQTYRPDVVRMIADELGLAFRDFRAEHMAPLGWKAGRLTLDELDQIMVGYRSEQGLVLHNVEALLAAKPERERRAWLSQFVKTESDVPVLVPLAIFSAEAPKHCARVSWINPVDLPGEKLLLRLASQ